MLYLISQMLFSLVLAGLLGAAVAWWFQRARGNLRLNEMSRVIQKQQRMVAQTDTDVRLVNEDYDELKRQSVEEITRLREENRKIAVLEHNLQKSQLLVRQLLQNQGQQGAASVTSPAPPAPARTDAQPPMPEPVSKHGAAMENAPSADAGTSAEAEVGAGADTVRNHGVAQQSETPVQRPKQEPGPEAAPAATPAAALMSAKSERRRTGGLESRVATGRNRKQKSVPSTPPSFEPSRIVPADSDSRDLPTTALPVSGHADSLVPVTSLHTSHTPIHQSPSVSVRSEAKLSSRSARRGWGSAPTPDVTVSAELQSEPPKSKQLRSEPPELEAPQAEPPESKTPQAEPPQSKTPQAEPSESELPAPEPASLQSTPNESRSSNADTLRSRESVPETIESESKAAPSPVTKTLTTLNPRADATSKCDVTAETTTDDAFDAVVAVTPEPSLIYDPIEPYDDLQQIVGIGPLTEKGLNRLGITTYSQLAHLDSQDIVKIAEALEIGPGRIASYDWVGSARQQLEDVLEEL